MTTNLSVKLAATTECRVCVALWAAKDSSTKPLFYCISLAFDVLPFYFATCTRVPPGCIFRRLVQSTGQAGS